MSVPYNFFSTIKQQLKNWKSKLKLKTTLSTSRLPPLSLVHNINERSPEPQYRIPLKFGSR